MSGVLRGEGVRVAGGWDRVTGGAVVGALGLEDLRWERREAVMVERVEMMCNGCCKNNDDLKGGGCVDVSQNMEGKVMAH